MLGISKEQYEAIKPIAEELLQKDGYVDTNTLILEIERRVLEGKIPPVFTATLEETYTRYRFEVIHSFMQRWETERKEYWLGVSARGNHIQAYYRLEDAQKEPRVAGKAKQEYLTGLTMLKTYAPYASTWGAPLEEVLADLDEVKEHITANWKEAAKV